MPGWTHRDLWVDNLLFDYHLIHHNQLYFMYAGYGHFPDYGTAIYIVRMTNPWTVEGDNVLLTVPTLEWEKQGGMAINEGPVILKRNGKVFLVYSASTTWSEDYALGMLTMDEASDPMDPSSWAKSMVPVFRKNVENGVFATGHNSFTVSPDGTEDWIVYHALSAPNEDTSLRSTRVQKFSWRSDGTPDFGIPIGTTEDIAVPSGE